MMLGPSTASLQFFGIVGDVDTVWPQRVQGYHVDCAFVGAREYHRCGAAVIVGAQPVRRRDAPTIAWLQSGKPVGRHRSGQIVTDTSLMRQELKRHDRANGMQANVFRRCGATAVAEEPGHRVGSARLQSAAQHVAIRHRHSMRARRGLPAPPLLELDVARPPTTPGRAAQSSVNWSSSPLVADCRVPPMPTMSPVDGARRITNPSASRCVRRLAVCWPSDGVAHRSQCRRRCGRCVSHGPESLYAPPLCAALAHDCAPVRSAGEAAVGVRPRRFFSAEMALETSLAKIVYLLVQFDVGQRHWGTRASIRSSLRLRNAMDESGSHKSCSSPMRK